MPNIKNILLVDDELVVTEVLAKVLLKLNPELHVETAQSGEKALAKLHRNSYHLLISDYHMPHMSGLELAQFARAVSPETNVILMSDHISAELQSKIKQFNLSGYLKKPFTRTQFLKVIQNTIGTKASPHSSPSLEDIQLLDWEMRERLAQLRLKTQARCVVLLSNGGFPLEIIGDQEGLDVQGVGVLAVANCAVFNTNYQEGDHYNLFSQHINHKLFIAVFFHKTESSLEIIRFYTQRAVKKLSLIADEYLADRTENPIQAPMLVTTSLADQLTSALDEAIVDESDLLFEPPLNNSQFPPKISLSTPDEEEKEREINVSSSNVSIVINGIRIAISNEGRIQAE